MTETRLIDREKIVHESRSGGGGRDRVGGGDFGVVSAITLPSNCWPLSKEFFEHEPDSNEFCTTSW